MYGRIGYGRVWWVLLGVAWYGMAYGSAPGGPPLQPLQLFGDVALQVPVGFPRGQVHEVQLVYDLSLLVI